MNTILFDDKSWEDLLPLTFTRPVSEIRIGMLTIREKWEKYLENSCSYYTQPYLSEKFQLTVYEENLIINSGVLPNQSLVNAIQNLQLGSVLMKDDTIIASKTNKEQINTVICGDITSLDKVAFENEIIKINYPWDIFTFNGQAIEEDFNLLTKSKKSAPISDTNNVLHPEKIFLEEGATVEFATLNAKNGPIYICKDAEVMEGSIIRGGFYLGEGSATKMGSKIYGPTTIGPHCKVGGEINNSVIFGYSNKGHDGFLGNSVLGEWCNLGADTNNSNLKNNYAQVRLWNYPRRSFMKTGLQFAGLIMGDHSKTGINTMLNTGTVVGVSSNIFGSGFPRNFVPSFSWGGASGFEVYSLNKAFDTAQKMTARRNVEFGSTDQKILETIFNETEQYRQF